MKKWLFALMAVMLVSTLTITSCGDDSSGDQVVITFNQNYAGAPAATTKKIDKGAAIGTLPAPTREGFALDGWYGDAAGAGTKISATTKFDTDFTLYAKWAAGGVYVLPTDAITLGDFNWTNNDNQKGWAPNGVDGVVSTLTTANIIGAEYLVLYLGAAPAGGLQFVWQGNADGWGWNQNDVLSGSGEAIADNGASLATTSNGTTVLKIELSKAAAKYDDFKKNTQAKILIAYYTGGIAGLDLKSAYLIPDPNFVPGPDLTGVELVKVTNGWYPVYRFVLPAGKTWGDYKGLSADYMFTAENLATARSRNGRVMGPYEPGDFTFFEGAAGGTAAGKKMAIANYNGGKNAEYILDGGKLGNNSDEGSLVSELEEKAGIAAVGDEWFTYDGYIIDGSTKNGSYIAANLPADNATGPFYFGLGLPAGAASDPANIYYIKNVKLIGYTAADTVTATPLYFEKDGVKIPAYAGYNTTDGSNGFADASREMADGSQPAAVLAGFEKVSVTNGWYAVYKFDLPTGKTWEDYKALSADYMFTAADLATARSRNGRVMGPYKEADFTFYEGDAGGSAPGKKMMVANYNGGKNAEYILDGGKLANKSDEGCLASELEEKWGIAPVGGTWFTYDGYIIDGSAKNGAYVVDLAAVTGTIYIGIGLPAGAASDPVNTYSIRNVKLIGYEAADTISAVPAYLKDASDPAYHPAFTGYNTADGSNGFADAVRVPVK